jgi:hypothetical protein
MASRYIVPLEAHKKVFLHVVVIIAYLVALVAKGILVIHRHYLNMSFVLGHDGDHFFQRGLAIRRIGHQQDTITEPLE